MRTLAQSGTLLTPLESGTYAGMPENLDVTLYVSANSKASDANDGFSEGTAKRTIAAALAALGSNPGKIVLSGSTNFNAFPLPSGGITLPGQRIVGNTKVASVLTYAGSGTAVTVSSFGGLENVRVHCTGSAETVVALKLLDGTFSTSFTQVYLSAAAIVAGQKGIVLVGAAAGTYWNCFDDIIVDTFDSPIGFQSSSSGANANSFANLRVHNFATTGIDLGDAYGNEFVNVHLDTFSGGVGIRGNAAVANLLTNVRAEGGADSQLYALGSGTAHNTIYGYDNCTNPSTDAGIGNSTSTNGQPEVADAIIVLDPLLPPHGHSGAWTLNIDALCLGNGYVQSDGVSGSFYYWDVDLVGGGTYTVEWIGFQNTVNGIVTLQLDGVAVGTADTGGTLQRNTSFAITGMAPRKSGRRRVTLVSNTKSAGSAYFITLQKLQIRRTG
jgi:hypothetical protein